MALVRLFFLPTGGCQSGGAGLRAQGALPATTISRQWQQQQAVAGRGGVGPGITAAHAITGKSKSSLIWGMSR